MDQRDGIVAACERLRLYNEKAAELNASTFVRQVREGRPVFRFLSGPFRAIREGGPDAEAMKAFVLTFRLFCRDRDGLSFREIEQLYESLPVSARLKEEIKGIRADVNRFLDGNTPIVVSGETISRRHLFDTWLFGEVAHLNPERRAQLRAWRVEDDIRPLYQHEFEDITLALLQAVFWVRTTNLDALAELEAAAAAQS
jgi:hypothetical protein